MSRVLWNCQGMNYSDLESNQKAGTLHTGMCLSGDIHCTLSGTDVLINILIELYEPRTKLLLLLLNTIIVNMP